jgi:hypothetical protein
LDDEVVVPLLARLTTLKTILASTPESTSSGAGAMRSEARALLEKIERQMAQLKDVVGRIDKTEKEIRYSFDPVERHVDDAIRAADKMEGICSKLREVDAEMASIQAKVHKAYNLAKDCGQGEGDRGAPSRRAVAFSNGGSSVINERTEEIWRSPQMQHIRLVVRGLDEQLRGCLICLAAFPEGDAIIKKRVLIHWWIGEGFVASSKEGSRRFKDLVDKGFIIPLGKDHCDKIHRCRLMPWLRESLAGLANRSNFLDAEESTDFTGRSRAFLRSRRTSSPLNFNPAVTTVYNMGRKHVQLDKGCFAGKKNLSSLQLGQWREFAPLEQVTNPDRSHIEVSGTERLAELGQCNNLRYVSFRGISRIETLPDSIGKLRHLVVLDLRACHNLQELGQEVTKLDHLQYLDLSECHLLTGMPKGIGRLTRLEVLKGFVIANFKSKDLCHLNELAKLPQLRKLSVIIGKTAVPAVGEFKKLGEFQSIKALTIAWGVQFSTAGDKSTNTSAIANMEFVLPPHLEKLDLRGFPLPDFQKWAHPKHVKKLYIRGGNLRTLGEDQDWEVEVLRLRFLKDFNYDHDRLQHSFKKLTSDLTLIHECPNFNT